MRKKSRFQKLIQKLNQKFKIIHFLEGNFKRRCLYFLTRDFNEVNFLRLSKTSVLPKFNLDIFKKWMFYQERNSKMIYYCVCYFRQFFSIEYYKIFFSLFQSPSFLCWKRPNTICVQNNNLNYFTRLQYFFYYVYLNDNR